MNTNRDLLKRLLHLYPIKNVKEYYNLKGNSDEVIDEILAKNSATSIKEFSYLNHATTRQNIYLFTLDKNFNRAKFINENFPLGIEKEVLETGEYIFFCLPKTTFNVYLSNPVDKEDLTFLQPVRIRVKNKSLVIQYTKLEKHVSNQYPEIREARKAGEKNTETDTLRKIISYFSQEYKISKNDVNKGVKHLWDIDALDCFKIAFQKAHSNSVETMHGTMTFKQKYPVEYEQIILSPIGSAHWKYLLTDDVFCENFICDLTDGYISIHRFPKHANQIENVITKILANN